MLIKLQKCESAYILKETDLLVQLSFIGPVYQLALLVEYHTSNTYQRIDSQYLKALRIL